MFTNQELTRQLQKINTLIQQAKELEPDDELRSHLAKYICVLCSGFIENAVYHTFMDITDRETESEVVKSYAKSQLYKIQNANSEKIRNLAKSFKVEWHDPIKEFMQENDRAAAINYILRDRHNIAHGRDSDITIARLEQYLNKTVEVIKYIEDELPTSA